MQHRGCHMAAPRGAICGQRDFHGDVVDQYHNFALESSIQIFHRGIVWWISQTTKEPWSLIFPHFNGMDLGDMLECVPPPQGSFANVLVAQGEAARRSPTVEEFEMCKRILEHAPSFMHALVRAIHIEKGLSIAICTHGMSWKISPRRVCHVLESSTRDWHHEWLSNNARQT